MAEILESCALFARKNVQICEEKIPTFVEVLRDKARNVVNETSDHVLLLPAKPFPGFPLVFPTLMEEVNFVALTQLLNFGSGFRQELHVCGGKGAAETMLFGCISMYLSAKVDADFMSKFSLFDVSTHFQIQFEEEVSLENSPIKISRASALKPLAEKIVFIMNDTGRVLRGYQCSNLADYLMRNCDPEEDAFASMFKKIIRLRAFQDQLTIKGKTVLFYKKAQVLMFDLGKFGDSNSCFKWENPQFTVFADNVLPAILINHEIILVSVAIASKIEKLQSLSDEEDAEIRSATIIACETICKLYQCKATDLDDFLWKLGKDEKYRKIKRHVNKHTLFY